MDAKPFLICSLVLTGLFGTSAPAYSQQSPPESETAKHIVAIVEKAAALIDKNGKAAFPEFRQSGSEWRGGDIYVFVDDMSGLVLFNAGNPKAEGNNIAKLMDSDGKILHAEFVNAVKSKGSGWVDYMFPKPGKVKPEKKWAYLKAVTVDGKPGYVGAGFYPE